MGYTIKHYSLREIKLILEYFGALNVKITLGRFINSLHNSSRIENKKIEQLKSLR